ncbi:MAG TPA: hypothetical protein VGF55_08485 [Gemmataceae bacterium]|jgi:hypothetical protein
MTSARIGLIRSAASAVFAALLLSGPAAPARDDGNGQQRLDLMRSAVASLEPQSSALPHAALAVAPTPLLRYSDPTRGGIKEAATNVLLDAAVWRLGTEGRPTALVTTEIYQNGDHSRVLAYEFLSLTATPFSLRHRTQPIRWDATGSGLALKALPDAPKPAATAAARLPQMRLLAKRFAVKERVNDVPIECRLLPQPIDRYRSDADKIVDGAIFAYANGTNPEVGVLFECGGEHWRYGCLRLTAAECHVQLDGREVAAFEKFDARGHTDGPYHNGAHKLPTPQ